MKYDENETTQVLNEIGQGSIDLDQISGETVPLVDDNQSDDEIPKFGFAKRLKIPDHICSTNRQLVILTCDRSASMGGKKIDELNLARFALAKELADPQNKDGFFLGLIEFNSSAHTKLEPQTLIGLQMTDAIADGGTNFDVAIDEVINMISSFNARANPEGWNYLRPQVLFLSDGHSSVTQSRIDDLQEIANVWSIAYGADADQKTLARIANDGEVHYVGTQGGELRQFLASVGETLSEGLTQA